MGYADELLAKDEVILRRDRPHWILPFQIAGRWVGIAVLVTVVSLVLNLIVFQPGGTGFLGTISSFIGVLLGWITLLAFLIAVAGFGWSVALWNTQEYVLTNQRVIHIRGLANKRASDSSLESLSDARIEVPALGRALGFGDLSLMTGSEAGDERLRALRDPIGFMRAIMEAKIERSVMVTAGWRAAAAAVPGPFAVVAAPAPVAPTVPAPAPAVLAPAVPAPAVLAPAVPAPAHVPAEEIAKTIAALASLRDSGAITPQDFDAKKRELLARI
jgi:hypothetical protein